MAGFLLTQMRGQIPVVGTARGFRLNHAPLDQRQRFIQGMHAARAFVIHRNAQRLIVIIVTR
ncbi:hypothetical protein D3C81_2224710 [compost metagenome]